MKKLDLAAAVTAVLSLTSVAHAQVFTDGRGIGLNFSGGAGTEAPDPDVDTVDVGEVTGVVAQDFWNNGQGANGSLGSLTDSTGTVSGATVTWASTNTWGRNITPSPTNDLLSDYLDGGSDGATPGGATVTFSNVPFSLYDVYVYIRRNESSDNTQGGRNFLSDYTVNGVTQNVRTGDVRDAFVPATEFDIGNFVKFENVSGSTLTMAANTGTANFRSPVDGVQVVEQVIPEPASATVAAIGMMSLLGLRRFRRS